MLPGFSVFYANHLQFKMCILYYCLSELGFPTLASIQNIILICKRFCKKTESPGSSDLSIKTWASKSSGTVHFLLGFLLDRRNQKLANARCLGQNPPTRRNIFKKRTIIRYNGIFPFFSLCFIKKLSVLCRFPFDAKDIKK